MDVRPFGADALFSHVSVQSEAVFSYAMTMDKIQGWEEEEKKGGIPICHVHVYLHHKSIDKRTNTNSSSGRVFAEANVVHYVLHDLGLCWNFRRSRVGVRKYHFPHEEAMLGMELDYGLDVPCVVQWSLMWFSAPTRLNKILEQDLKIKKYHEVVDKAIAEAILRPF